MSEKDRLRMELPGVESVPLAGLRRIRRTKHFDLMRQVLAGLTRLPDELALKVPLGAYSAKDLRSAVVRVAASHHMEISSSSDAENLYVWRRRS